MNSKTIVGCVLIAVALGMTVAILSKSSRRFTQRRLDDEAVERMDDEGGSNNPSTSTSGVAG
jgi:hypothetical protein